MRRLSRIVCGFAFRGLSTGETISNSFSGATEGSGQVSSAEAHPLLYQVPVLASRTIGREAEVRTLWQNLLAGRHFQMVGGMDGIGKSTIAAEFCDTVRHSQRFSCIQWFSGRHALPSQLQHFFASMKGRKERDVLLVLDDVERPDEALALIPEHANVYVLLTTSAPDVASSTKLAVLNPTALSPQSSQQFLSELTFSDKLESIFYNLGYVPLLLHIAALLLEGDVCSPARLQRILEERHLRQKDTLSISAALSVLLDVGVAELEKTYPPARHNLRVLSCFHPSDISDAVVWAVVGDSAGQFAVTTAQLGIFSLKWEEGAFALHPLVAKVLRGSPLDPAVLEDAAEALLRLWPRRWRNMGSHVAYNLVWHTYAMLRHAQEAQLELPSALLASMDRSATFLAHVEARDLAIAAEMWQCMDAQRCQRRLPPTPDSVRVLRECGRLLHYLKDAKAERVLRCAWQDSVAVHGKNAAESALILGCLAPHLAASNDSIGLTEEAVAVLEGRLASVDVVLSKEEVRMLWQSIYVLLLCKGQYMAELGMAIPDDLHRSLDRAAAEAKKMT